MADLSVNRLTNGNVYVDGASFFGTFEEFDIPDLKAVYADFKALGMNAKIELPSGIDKLEAKAKFNAPYAKVMKLQGDPYTVRQIMLRGNLETYVGNQRTGQVPYVVTMAAGFKNVSPGKVKQQDNVEMESTLNVTAMKVVIDKETIIEFDALNNIHIVDGVDLLLQYRQNLGI